MGHGVLDNQPLHPLRMGHGKAVADRAAIILQVQGVPAERQGLDEAFDHLGDVVEGVGELLARRRIGISEAWKVRRDQVIAVGQALQQGLEHPRR